LDVGWSTLKRRVKLHSHKGRKTIMAAKRKAKAKTKKKAKKKGKK
jgi:hypothetical protein